MVDLGDEGRSVPPRDGEVGYMWSKTFFWVGFARRRNRSLQILCLVEQAMGTLTPAWVRELVCHRGCALLAMARPSSRHLGNPPLCPRSKARRQVG